MKILNIHGCGGRPQNCAYAALQENGCDTIIAPAINYEKPPLNIVRQLRQRVRCSDIDLIVGTSLGAFYAAVLSVELDLPVILVSPFLMPFLTFPEYVKEYLRYAVMLEQLDLGNVSCIIGEDDEEVDHRFTRNFLENERFRSIPGGGHSGATLPLKEYFRQMLPYYVKKAKARNTAADQAEKAKGTQYKFENFIFSDDNCEAFEKAVKFTEPGQAQVLCVLGNPGTGKTHLLYAVRNRIWEDAPDTKVILTNVEEMLMMIRTGDLMHNYHHADVLLVDDIQCLAGKERTQEEFILLFNELYEAGKRIMLTGSGADIPGICERIRERCHFGEYVEIRRINTKQRNV